MGKLNLIEMQVKESTDGNENKNIADEIESEFKGIKENSRAGFVRKVYGILSSQFILTSIFVLMSLYNHAYKKFTQKNIQVFYLAFVITMISLYAIACYKDLARRVPINYVLLLLFTLGESYTVSCVTNYYNPETVAIAAVLTASMTFGLTIYAIWNKSKDLTYSGGLLFSLFFVL